MWCRSLDSNLKKYHFDISVYHLYTRQNHAPLFDVLIGPVDDRFDINYSKSLLKTITKKIITHEMFSSDVRVVLTS